MPTTISNISNAQQSDLQYDVAISFLMQDEALASAINDRLSEGLRVFFFPRKQEDLAGTDGMESMREPFLESRISVIIYRPEWGHTPWTGVEAEAIKDACLMNQFQNLFFLVVEPTHDFPKWVPHHHVRFNYADYGLEQAIGAIKMRVQDRGGEYQPMTPRRKAESLRLEQVYKMERSNLSSQEGRQATDSQASILIEEMGREIEDLNNRGHHDFECEVTSDACVLRGELVGMIVRWTPRNGTLMQESSLEVEEYSGHLWFKSDPPRQAHHIPPDRIKHDKYAPELSRAREYGWRREGQEDFIQTKVLAEKCLIQFMELIERSRRGEISPPAATPFHNTSPWTRPTRRMSTWNR